MAIELERTTEGGIERIVATCGSNDELALQRFTEEQHASGFDIGSGNSFAGNGQIQRTYTRPVEDRSPIAPDAEVEAEPEAAVEPEVEVEDDDDQEEAEINATDGALALADENDIDLEGVVGTGADGRIVIDDVRALMSD